MAQILNRSCQNNYTSDNKIFILDGFDMSKTAELLGNISNMVDDLPWGPVFTTTPLFKESANLTNPYELTSEYPPVIDVYINSPGGDTIILSSISSLLELAKAKGAIIRTNVIGQACSCGSLLAVQGTPNFRIMFDKSYHFIHFGRVSTTSARVGEIETSYESQKRHLAKIKKVYKDNTKLTDKQLNDFFKTEGAGELSPKQCLKFGICDWVLSPKGIFIKNSKLVR